MLPDRFVLQTERLRIRAATHDDAGLYLRLWTCPQIMRLVGFSHGLRITREQIEEQIAGQGDVVFDQLLVIEVESTGACIGECRIHRPDTGGVATTDVKLHPDHWGKRYGTEIKQALVDYLFTHTECSAVQGTPNVENVASIRMQEAVGGVRVGRGVHEFPDSQRLQTRPVQYHVYRVFRSRWEEMHRGAREP